MELKLATEESMPIGEQPEEGFFIFHKGEKKGPFSKQVILEKFAAGEIDSQTMVKIDNQWIILSETNWISESAEELTPPEPAYEETIPPAPTTTVVEKMITCPHCYCQFRMSEINYISRHIKLIGDKILGPDAQQRFLPTKFTPQGFAIDAYEMICQDMACPNCHLRIPEAIIDVPSIIFSIAGAPASGKSYYLTAMTWQLRSILAKEFDYSFVDTDATFNSVLNNYESILFLNRCEDEYVALPKTELQGNDFSHQIMLEDMTVDLPLPFIFTLTPLPSNQNYPDPQAGLRNIIFYDNAGEHFEPGRDQVTNLSTQHLIYSSGITFLYDPIKDSRMVTQCNSKDPQVARISRGTNQLILLNEMISRIKRYTGLKSNEKYNKPLVVIIPKYDAWRESFPIDLEQTEFTYYSQSRLSCYLDISAITNVSYIMREELLRISPEVVATCESFFSTVYFIPVSALGQMPEYDQEKDMIAIKPQHLKPIWAEVPILLQFWLAGLIEAVAPEGPDSVPIENYRFSENSLIYTLPNSRERENVPSNYWGYTVFNRKIGKYIKFPSDPAATETQPEADVAMDDFWQQ